MSEPSIQKSGGLQLNDRSQKQKRGRRSRKDGDQRVFICKQCQKSYLSNAALYTHVKNKHQPPDKTQKPTKQKQPTQNKNQSSSPQPPQPQLNLQSSKQHKQFKYESIDQQELALENLRNYMKKYFPQRNRGCSIKLICEDLAPQNYQYIQPILKSTSEKKYHQVDKINLSINKVFGIFLLLINTKVSSACINFLLRLFFYLNLALKIQSKKQDYCQKQNAMNLPNFFNSIILNKRIPALGFDQEQMMYNPIIICHVLEYFGNWLYDERFTDYKIIPEFQKNG